MDRVSGEWWRGLHELPSRMLKQSSSIVLGIVQTLNVPQRVRLGSSLAAALLDELFEHSA